MGLDQDSLRGARDEADIINPNESNKRSGVVGFALVCVHRRAVRNV